MSGSAVAAIVSYAYTGSIELKGSTVVAIIRAADLLQVSAVADAAVDFLVEGLGKGCYFLVFVPTIGEIREFYREM
eukprot:SAG31_NODE_1540_length_7954_cov_3.521961_6_plen_76_part_00